MMMSLWLVYGLVAVLLVIFLIVAAIGFTRSGRRRATNFRGVAGTESDPQREEHEKEAQRR
jgi:hypothetical protein